MSQVIYGTAGPSTPGLVRQLAYNVRDYGAIGDGTTDDTAAIQDAITAAALMNTTGGMVFLPAGKYKTTSTLTLTGSVSFVGSGWSATYLLPADTSHDVLAVAIGAGSKSFNRTIAGFAVYPLTNCTAGAGLHLGNVGKYTVRDIKMDASLGGAPYVGVQLDEVADTVFDNVRIETTVSDAWLLATANTKVITELFWSASCTARNAGGWGFRVAPGNTSSGDIEGLHWEATSIYHNTSGGILLNTGASGTKTIRNIHLNGTYLDTNTGPGLQITGTPVAENIAMLNVWCSANGGRGYDLGANLRYFCLSGGFCMHNGLDGARLTGCQNGLMNGLLIKSNSQTTDLASYGLYVTGATQEVVFSAFICTNDSGGYPNRQNGLFVDSTVLDLDFFPCKIDTGAGTTKLSHNAASSARVRYHTVRDNTGSNNVWQLKQGGSGSDVAVVDLFGSATYSGTNKAAGFLETISTKTGNYTLTVSDATVIANAATLTITLPAASAIAGRRYTVKNGPSGTSTALGSSGGTIDGNTAPWSPAALTAAYGKISVISDGTNWLTVS